MSTAAPSPAAGAVVDVVDDRLAHVSLATKLLRRPELGAAIAAVAVALFFALTTDQFMTLDGISNWTDVASTIGIPAVAVALLMIGGEFDLSAGVMTGSAGLFMGILATKVGMNMWLAIALTLLAAAGVGFLNGYMVMKTKLPSFIVTLATFFILQGANLGVTKAITGTVLVTGVLARTRVGNWIFGVGGDANAARNVGVPVAQVKIGLFVTTATVSALTGIMIALRLAYKQANQGVGDEFTFIIAAVVGGCLLTGGFGSALGAALGALIVGMAFIGIQFS